MAKHLVAVPCLKWAAARCAFPRAGAVEGSRRGVEGAEAGLARLEEILVPPPAPTPPRHRRRAGPAHGWGITTGTGRPTIGIERSDRPQVAYKN